MCRRRDAVLLILLYVLYVVMLCMYLVRLYILLPSAMHNQCDFMCVGGYFSPHPKTNRYDVLARTFFVLQVLLVPLFIYSLSTSNERRILSVQIFTRYNNINSASEMIPLPTARRVCVAFILQLKHHCCVQQLTEHRPLGSPHN